MANTLFFQKFHNASSDVDLTSIVSWLKKGTDNCNFKNNNYFSTIEIRITNFMPPCMYFVALLNISCYQKNQEAIYKRCILLWHYSA